MKENGYRRLHTLWAGFGRRILLPLFVCLAFSGQGCALVRPPGGGEDAAVFFSADSSSGGVTGKNRPDGHPGQTDDASADSVEDDERQPAESGGPAPETEHPEKPAGYVHVYGAVARPGVYEIRSGMRLFEVIEAAGGFTSAADDTWLNLAGPVSDGEQIQVPTRQEAQQLRLSDPGDPEDSGDGGTHADTAVSGDGGTRADTDGSGDGGTQSGPVNINTASLQELVTLPGIGPTRAEAILQYRQAHGAFGSIEEICSVSGIKQATFEKLKDRITV